MALHQPLDLEYWLVNVFAGTAEIFISVALIAIFWLCSKLRVDIGITTLLAGLFLVLMKGFIGTEAFFVLAVLVATPVIIVYIRRLLE